MEQSEISWKDSNRVWWSFFWRATLIGAIAGAIFGGVAGGIMGAIDKLEYAETAGSIMGYIVAIPVSMWCFKKVLNKKFKGYSFKLVKTDDECT